MLHEQQVSFKLEKEKKFLEARCTRKCRYKSLVVDESHKIEKFRKRTYPKVFKNMEHNEATLRDQPHTEELVMAPMVENVKETSESDVQAVKSGQERAAFLQSDVESNSRRFLEHTKQKRLTKKGGGAKYEEDSRKKLVASLTYASSTAKNKLFATFHADRKSRCTMTCLLTRRRRPFCSKKPRATYRRDVQTQGNKFHRPPLLFRTHAQSTMKVSRTDIWIISSSKKSAIGCRRSTAPPAREN